MTDFADGVAPAVNSGAADAVAGALSDARFAADHFALFGLARDFRIDTAALERNYRALQAQTHPDRFVTASDSERRRALQWATRVNEAYETLKKPLSRARYLLAELGGESDFVRNNALPTDFLVAQMELRETVADAVAARQVETLESLRDERALALRAGYEALAAILAAAAAVADSQRTTPLAQAADAIRRLMFEEKLLADIDDALAALDE